MQTSVHKNYTRVASSIMHTDTLVGETARTFVCHRGSKVAHERETQRETLRLPTEVASLLRTGGTPVIAQFR